MPPKRKNENKYLSHYQEFIGYSAHAFHAAQDEDLDAGRTLGRRRWREIGQDDMKKAYTDALDAKRTVQDQIDDEEAKVQTLQGAIDDLLQQDVTVRNNRSLMDNYGALRLCRGTLDILYGRLSTRSTALENAINAIYPDDDMRNHAARKHRQVVDAHTAAHDYWANFETLEDQFGIPETRNGERKILEDLLPKFKTDRKENQRQQDFLQEDLPNERGNDPNTWHGSWPVTHPGGHSLAAIWVQADHAERIVDRLVRKNVHKTADEWADVTQWQYPDDGMRNEDEIRPMELVCNSEMGNVTSTRFGQKVDVTTLRACEVDIPNLAYTLYLDYCGYGDLSDLTDRYAERPEPIPEPFLWRVFLSLSVAGLAMEKGTVISHEENRKNWPLEIVHRDVKPNNVFLDEPTRGHFETYPTVRLGDFGIAIKTHRKDALNPTIFLKFEGTHDFAAPEQKASANLRDARPVHRYKQLSWTNVYSTGLIMFSLMTKRWPEERYWWGDGGQEHDIEHEDYHANVSNYSQELRDLVQGCLHFDPTVRTSFELLLVGIETAIESGAWDQGRMYGRRGDEGMVEQDEMLFQKDKYASALHLNDLDEAAEE